MRQGQGIHKTDRTSTRHKQGQQEEDIHVTWKHIVRRNVSYLDGMDDRCKWRER